MGIIPNPILGASSPNRPGPTRYENLLELDYLINICDSVSREPASPLVWALGESTNKNEAKSIPQLLLMDFCPRASRVLANIGSPTASAALLSFRKIDFWRPNRCFHIVESRPAQPTPATRRKYAHLLAKVGKLLTRVRNVEFLGQNPPSARPGTLKNLTRTARVRKGTHQSRTAAEPSLSQEDRARCERIGKDKIATHTNSELWKMCKRSERQLWPDLTYGAFRKSIDRSRKYFGLPWSNEIKK